MHSTVSDDTEITLGAGKLLGLFFLLAAICGVFFSIGYSLGKSSGREQALNDQPAQLNAVAPSDSVLASTASQDGKPPAGVASKPEAQTSAADQANANNQQNLTFYKAVQQNDGTAQSSDKTPEKVAQSGETAKTSAEKTSAPKVTTAAATTLTVAPPPAAAATTAKPAAAVISHTSPVTGPGTIVVQIAAVTREDDAVALAGALRKKNYNVFVVNNPITNDKFYHVQVGPFSTMAEAEAMKTQLIAEGYNPIIKR